MVRMERNQRAFKGHGPIRFLAIVCVLTAAVLLWLGGGSYRLYRADKVTKECDARIEQLRGRIVHLDEVLTMSARMAAQTGDLNWEERYHRFEPKLDEAIKEAKTLASEAYSGEAAAQTDAANIALIEAENRAFDLVRQGHLEEAQAVLFGNEYARQKRIYAQGMARTKSLLCSGG